MLDTALIYVPGRTEWEGSRFHHVTQNDEFKTMNCFISGSETMDQGTLLYYQFTLYSTYHPDVAVIKKCKANGISGIGQHSGPR